MIKCCFVLFVALLDLMFIGCGDENCLICPNGNQEAEYYITWSYGLYPGNVFFTYRFSTLTHEIIDSVQWPRQPPARMAFTPDGRYFIFADTEDKTIYVTNSDGRDTVAAFLSRTRSFGLNPKGDLLATADSRGLVLLTVPGLAEIFRDTAQLGVAIFGPSGNIFATAVDDSVFLYRLDANWALDSRFAVTALDGEPVRIAQVIFAQDENCLFLVTARLLGPYFFHVVEIESQRVVREHQLPFPSFLALTPAGDELFVGYYGILEDFGHGTVYRYDPAESTFVKYVDREDFEEPGPLPLCSRQQGCSFCQTAGPRIF